MVYYKKKTKTTYRPKRVYKKRRVYKKKPYRKKTKIDDQLTLKLTGNPTTTNYWHKPSLTSTANTDGEMTTLMPYTNDEGVTTLYRGITLGNLDNEQLTSLGAQFQYIRYKWIKITFTPETWTAASLASGVGASDLQDGEKPMLCLYNDDGSLALESGLADGISISSVQGRGNNKFRKIPFTKPVSVYLKGYSLNIPDRTAPKYYSMGTWNPLTTQGASDSKDLYVSDVNLWYGFLNLPKDSIDPLITNFKFKVDINYCVTLKGMR